MTHRKRKQTNPKKKNKIKKIEQNSVSHEGMPAAGKVVGILWQETLQSEAYCKTVQIVSPIRPNQSKWFPRKHFGWVLVDRDERKVNDLFLRRIMETWDDGSKPRNLPTFVSIRLRNRFNRSVSLGWSAFCSRGVSVTLRGLLFLCSTRTNPSITVSRKKKIYK